MSEIEKLKEIINKLTIENLLTRLLTIVTMCSFTIFALYMVFAKEFDTRAIVLLLSLVMQILVIEIFVLVNR
jgi:hypothetical protein